MSFKREHKYSLKIHEEQLYKEVMFDARPSYLQGESIKFRNSLKKVSGQSDIRNLNEFIKEAKKVAWWPKHK